MKTRVIPKEVRDLSKARGSRYALRVIRAPSVRSLAVLGMTAWFAWLLLPKPPLLDGISFSQCVRDRSGKLLRVTLSADQKFRLRRADPTDCELFWAHTISSIPTLPTIAFAGLFALAKISSFRWRA